MITIIRLRFYVYRMHVEAKQDKFLMRNIENHGIVAFYSCSLLASLKCLLSSPDPGTARKARAKLLIKIR